MAEERKYKTGLKILENLEDKLKCTICCDKLENPHICINCSQYYCLKCIVDWLKIPISNGQCPHCKQRVIGKLVKIRWLDDFLTVSESKSIFEEFQVFDRLQSIQNEDNKDCETHKQPNNLFCSKCSQIVCVECWDSPLHENHPFKTVNKEYGSSLAQLDQELQNIRNQLLHYTDLNRKFFEKIENISEEKTEILRKLENQKNELKEVEQQRYMSKIEKIEAIYDDKVEEIQQQESDLVDELEDKISEVFESLSKLEKLEKEIETVKNQSKYNVITKAQKITKDLTDESKQETKTNINLDRYLLYELKVDEKLNEFSKVPHSSTRFSKQFKDLSGNNWRLKLVKTDDYHVTLNVELVSSNDTQLWVSWYLQILDQNGDLAIYNRRTDKMTKLLAIGSVNITDYLVDDTLNISVLIHVHEDKIKK